MKVLYFAWLRGKVGTGSEDVTPPADVRTVGELVVWLSARSPGHADAFSNPAIIRAAVNQEHAPPETAISDSDEVAFFPPVTGG